MESLAHARDEAGAWIDKKTFIEDKDLRDGLNTAGTAADAAFSVVGDIGGYLGPMGTPLSMVGGIGAGVGKMMHWEDDGHWDPNLGGIGDIAEGMGIPGGSLIQVGTNAAEATRRFIQAGNETDPTKKEEAKDAAWGAVGDTAIAGAHTLCGMAGVDGKIADVILSGGEMAIDGLGAIAAAKGGADAKFGAGDVIGGLARAFVPDNGPNSTWNTNAQQVQKMFDDPATGEIAARAYSGVTWLPTQLYESVAGGLYNTARNMFDDDRNENQDYFRQDLNQIRKDPKLAEWTYQAMGHFAD